MVYDLSNCLHRKQFVARANNLLKKSVGFITLTDNSQRTLSQNKYLHVLIRILAIETGVTESYSKNVYFKNMANFDMFRKVTIDPITNKKIQSLRSTTELSVDEMRTAITRFRDWAAEKGYYLPDAREGENGNMEFVSDKDRQAFEQGESESARLDNYLG